SIATYKDHRMALAFAPLALKVPLSIQEANVVSKSYPSYWDDLRTLQFDLEGLPK
ncbi:MAG: 3-phosphoshikimate 1-carboxyvinyltransferase, partial [Flavobacteriaceae bacterium]